MFYSLLTLNPRSHQVQREIAAPYTMHKTLLRAFPEGKVGIQRTDSEAADVLFRLDSHGDGMLTVLVQSRTEPDWLVLKPGYLLGAPQIKQRELFLQTGQLLSFRLRANPTKRMGKSAEYDQGKRVGIYDAEDQLAWLARKGAQHGFSVLQTQISRDGKIKDEKKVKPSDPNGDASNIKGNRRIDPPISTHKLELLSVQFDGILQVTDPARLVTAVETGIGSAKAFGFGLLSLAPARG